MLSEPFNFIEALKHLLMFWGMIFIIVMLVVNKRSSWGVIGVCVLYVLTEYLLRWLL